MKIQPMESTSGGRKSIGFGVWLALAFIAVLLLSTIADMWSPSRPNVSRSIDPVDTLPSEIRSTMTLDETMQYNADPDSAGFSDVDREFLKDHGVSEQEARAAETLLRQNGVN